MQGQEDRQTIKIDNGEWITAPEVAKHLRMTTAWVYTQTRAGLIPHVELGRYVRYNRTVIDSWLEGIECGGLDPAQFPTRGDRIGANISPRVGVGGAR